MGIFKNYTKREKKKFWLGFFIGAALGGLALGGLVILILNRLSGSFSF